MSQDVSTGGVIEAIEPEGAQAGVVKKTLGLGFWLAVGWIVLIALLALLAPVLPLKDPNANFIDIQGKGRPPYGPSGDHWLGSDQDARDMLSRTIYGARVSLVVGFSAVAFGFAIGGTMAWLVDSCEACSTRSRRSSCWCCCRSRH